MKKEYFIRRDDSTTLYGIAIILMVFHHCFCIPSRLNYNYIPVLGSYDVEARIAWQGKLCVGIFAFISGYAFSIISDKNMNNKLMPRFKENVMQSLRQLVKFYSKFWLVFIIFVPIGIIFYGQSASLTNLLNGFFRGARYNGEWWYVWQYVKFLAVFPFIDLVYYYKSNKATWIAVISAIAVVFIIRFVGWNTVAGTIVRFGFNQLYSNYMIIFLTAFLISKLNILEKIDCRCFIKPFFAVLGTALCFLLRWLLVTEPSQSNCDIFIIPFLIFFIVALLHSANTYGMTRRVINYVGANSTFIWLTHTFWLYYYFQRIALLPRYSIFIFIWVLILSLFTSIILTKIISLPKKIRLKK